MISNELIFFIHIAIVIASVMGALRLGKEALITGIALQGVIANLFVLKQITLFGMLVTTADVYIIGSMLALNLLQEYFGQKIALKTVWISFFSLLLFGILSQFQLFYGPNAHDFAHGSYATLLSYQPRLLFASFTAYLVVQQIDVRLFGILRKRLITVPLAVRSGLSMIVCQAIDTLIFTYLGLFGVLASLVDIMVMSFTIKVVIILCTTPFTALSRKLVRREV